MEIDKLEKLLLFSIIAFINVIIVLGAFLSFQSAEGEDKETVPCYDMNDNIIKGVKCVEETPSLLEQRLAITMTAIVLMTMFSSLLLALGGYL